MDSNSWVGPVRVSRFSSPQPQSQADLEDLHIQNGAPQWVTPGENMPKWQIEWQECQNRCQIEWQNICQKVCQNRCPIECQKDCQNRCQRKCEEYMTAKMPEGIYVRIDAR